MNSDEWYMRAALQQARLALGHHDVPVGAIAVKNGEIVARAHNERHKRQDPTAHAETLVLSKAARRLGSWRLDGVSIYVTLEPCPMCAGAMVAARVRAVVYGAPDEKGGAAWSLYNIVQDPRLNHRCLLRAGILADESISLLQEFFRDRRGRRMSLNRVNFT